MHEETCENSICLIIKEIHSPATLLGTPCEYQAGPPCTPRTALIHCGILQQDVGNILVHIDMLVSQSCCRFVSCTSVRGIPWSATSQRHSIEFRRGGHWGSVRRNASNQGMAFQSLFGERVRVLASVFWFQLKRAAPGAVFYCCSPSSSRLDEL